MSEVFVDAQNGSDSNPGTQAEPYLTFVKGAGVTGNGDRCRSQGTFLRETLIPVNDGASGDHAVFDVYGDGATIDWEDQTTGSAPDRRGISLDGRSYITIDGFEVTRCYGGGVQMQNGSAAKTDITLRNMNIHANNGLTVAFTSGVTIVRTHNLIIEDTDIQDNGDGNTATASGGNGVHFSGTTASDGAILRRCNFERNGSDEVSFANVTDCLVEYCLIGGCWKPASHPDALNIVACDGLTIRYSRLYDNRQLIYFPVGDSGTTCTNVKIHGNWLYDINQDADGVTGVGIRGTTGTGTLTNFEIWDNTFGYMGDTTGRGCFLSQTSSGVIDNIKQRNNLFYAIRSNVTTGANSILGTVTNIDYDYNLYFYSDKSTETEANSITGASDPIFRNYKGKTGTGKDAHLSLASATRSAGDPALSSVMTVPAILKDIDGQTRIVNSDDIGAYKYVDFPSRRRRTAGGIIR